MAPPSSRLSQGHFRDFDFLLADNFARAVKKNNVQHVIYVGGIIPKVDHLSMHLKSRLEVEKTFESHALPLTSLRCGLVIGPNGSSFRILERLVERLPFMLLPSWMKTKTQAVYINDLVEILLKSIHNGPALKGVYDVGTPNQLSYLKILLQVLKTKKKKTILISIPAIPLKISKVWIRFITGYSKDLVYPLVESLKHPMQSDPDKNLPPELRTTMTPLDIAVKESIYCKDKLQLSFRNIKAPDIETESEVQSVQRLPLPKDWSASKVANHYLIWLPKLFRTLIKVEADGELAYFRCFLFRKPLLVLKLSSKRSYPGRKLFYVTDGILIRNKGKGRLEFREGPYRKFVIAAIHRFSPTLPWFVYRFTQAQVHKVVMYLFGYYLSKR